MNIDNISSDSMQDTTLGEEGVDLPQEKWEEISTFARKHIPSATTSAKIIFVAGDTNMENTPNETHAGEWHGSVRAYGKMDNKGDKSFNFDLHQGYSGPEGNGGDLGVHGGVNQNGTLSGEIGYEHKW